eukprot:239146-Amphidinium_carterae.1
MAIWQYMAEECTAAMRKWMSNYKVQNHLLPQSSGPSRHAPPPPPGVARQQKSEKRSAPPQASVAKRAK